MKLRTEMPIIRMLIAFYNLYLKSCLSLLRIKLINQYNQKFDYAIKTPSRTMASNWQEKSITTLLAVSIDEKYKTVIDSMPILSPT